VTTPDPDETLRRLDPELADLKARAEQAQAQLASSSATSANPDGSVTVTVGPGGAMTGLTLTERAYQQDPARLAGQIMELAGKAQRQVGAQVMAAFGGLVGEDSPAMDVLTPFLPPPGPEDEQDGGDQPPPHPDEPYDSFAYGAPQHQAPPQAAHEDDDLDDDADFWKNN
jgi:YbaB/EbfC DNA-binding family